MPDFIGYSKQVSKRPGKKLVDKVTKASERLRLGQEYRQQQREEQWRKSVAQYEGSTAWAGNPDDRTADLVSVNISFSTINTLLPFVADENPSFIVSPYSGDSSAEHATILQTFLNRVWQSSKVSGTLHVRDSIFDYLLYGDGYVKVGYNIDDQPLYTADGEEIENQVEIAEFFVQRINPWDVWIDPYSDGIPNAQWVCHRIIMPIDQLEADDRFFFDRKAFGGGMGIDSEYLSPEDEHRLQNHTPNDWVTLYEFYDLRERWQITFIAGTNTIVRYVEHLECPIVQIQNYRLVNSPYHMGELEQIASLQDELNKTRSQMITHRRRNVAKWLVRSQVLNDEAAQAMRSSKINDIIPIESNEPFANIIAPVHMTPLSADTYQIDGQIRNDINEVTGVNEYLRGVPQNISRTATEASIIEGATNIRTRHKLLQVESSAAKVGQFLLNIMKDVLPTTEFNEMELFITGREAEKLNRAAGAEQLQQDAIITPVPEIFVGKYEVTVERGSTELRNPEVKAKQLKDMAITMLSATPLLMQIGVPFNIQRLLEMWFEAEGVDDVQALFEIDEEQGMHQMLALVQQAQAAAGGGGGGATGGPVSGGAPTGPGEPREQTTNAPTENPNDKNSGILAPR